ncbi:hypothetical protein SAMN02746065_11523 [Desulfocicer vacuolatum DSM 3385]|uniref:CopG family transcriptional regulator n=1 Tax=Desulfocicer vacuolatum DSM 3385 TaxID=1121400 RepID=A0A1W2D2I4_9BACT|nr:hypothetical protein [Desulfocicer vacuolatum]SMC91815.1 hypothetical protein SAMN02746065_11523 [Desulfocicer vacuolatum DSM 3385]
MNIGKIKLNIILPVELVQKFTKMAGPRKRSQLIADSVALRIKQMKNKQLDTLLAEGYHTEKEESIKIIKKLRL